MIGGLRAVLPLFFRITVKGRQNFPKRGPLIIVGNHIAAMEPVLMGVYSPWQIEFMATADIPNETITEIALRIYGSIPLQRGRTGRDSLSKALSVLQQAGFLGLFPEGGVWQPGFRQAHTGVAWISYRSQAPVLPIYFAGTRGAINDALRLKRPRLTMIVGETIPPVAIADRSGRRSALEAYANHVMDRVHALRPAEMSAARPNIVAERYELQVTTPMNGMGTEAPTISEAAALAQLLHTPAILKVLRHNLRLPVDPLAELDQDPAPQALFEAAQHVITYLDNENPFLLTYKFGPEKAARMRRGLGELADLAQWAVSERQPLQIVPVWRYQTADSGEVVQTQQKAYGTWM